MVGFPGGSVVKSPSANVGDTGLIPGSGRSPGEGSGNPSSILAWKIPQTERQGALQATVHGGHKRIGSDLATEQEEEEIMVMTVLLATIYHLPTAAYKAGSVLSI